MLIAKAKDPAFWEKVRTEESYAPLRDELKAQWEAHKGTLPVLSYADFMRYDVDGDRKVYEASYFFRRRALNAAALMTMIYPEDEAYLSRLCDVIWEILNEYTWVLPAHIKNFKSTVVECIDLFAAETAHALSEIDYILADRLPPLIRDRIRHEVDRRILNAYLNPEKRFWWYRCKNNWNAVCMGSVCGAFLYLHPERFGEIRLRVQETLACYLDGFHEDGICTEGIGYWNYGFGYFVTVADLLRDFTDGEINYFADPKVRKIAAFMQNVYLGNGVAVSFSDGGTEIRWHLGLVHYLKHEYPQDVMILPRAYAYSINSCARFAAHLRAFLWFDPQDETETEGRAYTNYAPDAGWFVKTTPAYGFAAKGGHNHESHNHNDLGSFIFACGGDQILRDLGSGVYNRSYFDSHRYESFYTSSRGHSVPIINGTYQESGPEHIATTAYDPDTGTFSVEFSRGYALPELTALTRKFGFGDDSVTMTDTYVYDGTLTSFTERFITNLKPDVTPEGVRLGNVLLFCAYPATVTEHIEPSRPNSYCIDYAVPADKRDFTLKIQIQA